MTQNNNGKCRIFPKLFIGDAQKAFMSFIKKSNYDYDINYILSHDDLVSLIEKYSNYRNYTLPVIISDISFLNHSDQSMLLKFMEDSNLKIILLASRDNILSTIISRVKEFRKFYISKSENKTNFININKARTMFVNDPNYNSINEMSEEDMAIMCTKYSPIIYYDNKLVSRFRRNDKEKILNLLEYNQ